MMIAATAIQTSSGELGDPRVGQSRAGRSRSTLGGNGTPLATRDCLSAHRAPLLRACYVIVCRGSWRCSHVPNASVARRASSSDALDQTAEPLDDQVDRGDGAEDDTYRGGDTAGVPSATGQ